MHRFHSFTKDREKKRFRARRDEQSSNKKKDDRKYGSRFLYDINKRTFEDVKREVVFKGVKE
jgi:hypothetical protein